MLFNSKTYIDGFLPTDRKHRLYILKLACVLSSLVNFFQSLIVEEDLQTMFYIVANLVFVGCGWGTYGYNCNETCESNCSGNTSCDPITGICPQKNPNVNRLQRHHTNKPGRFRFLLTELIASLCS